MPGYDLLYPVSVNVTPNLKQLLVLMISIHSLNWLFFFLSFSLFLRGDVV